MSDSDRSPARGLVLMIGGSIVFLQVVRGGLVDRIATFTEGTDGPPAASKNSGPRGIAYIGNTTARRKKFLALLMSQKGDDYTFGGETHGEKNPNSYDCSEFVQWAMNRLGYADFPDGTSNQYAHCHKISVARAIATPAACLYHPDHIAVSRGNGTTIEAQSTATDVGVFSAIKGRSWTTGLLIPELFDYKRRPVKSSKGGRVAYA